MIRLNIYDHPQITDAYIGYFFRGKATLGPNERLERADELLETHGIKHEWVPEGNFLNYEQFLTFPDEESLVEFILRYCRGDESR